MQMFLCWRVRPPCLFSGDIYVRNIFVTFPPGFKICWLLSTKGGNELVVGVCIISKMRLINNNLHEIRHDLTSNDMDNALLC